MVRCESDLSFSTSLGGGQSPHYLRCFWTYAKKILHRDRQSKRQLKYEKELHKFNDVIVLDVLATIVRTMITYMMRWDRRTNFTFYGRHNSYAGGVIKFMGGSPSPKP